MRKMATGWCVTFLLTGCGSSGDGETTPADAGADTVSDVGKPDAGPNLPPVVTCPSDQTAPVETTLSLSVSIEDDGDIEDETWDVLSAPPGSKEIPDPLPNEGDAVFTPLLPGVYELSYTVEDDAGQTDSCTFEVTATVTAGFRVELLWDVDTDPPPSTDMDLHVLHPTATVWFDLFDGLDCYWSNPAPVWGPGGAADDPTLYQDDADGRGPEGVEIPAPEEGGPYGIGIHYFSANGMGAGEATVNVYCDGALTQSFGPQALDAPDDLDATANDFWKVADVSFSGGVCTITPLDDGSGGPLIVTGADAEAAR